MTFEDFTNAAIRYAAHHPELIFGKALMEALRWNRESLLPSTPDISKENNALAPAIFAWFSEVERQWK